MQVGHVQVLGKAKQVTAHISLRVSWIDSRCSMKRLMKVTHIMNEKTKSEGFLLVSTVNSLSDIPVNEIVFVVSFFSEPVINVFDCSHDAVGVVYELRVVLQVAALVEVRSVNEMPVVLPLLSSFFQLISKC